MKIVVGDIHGRIDLLDSLINKIMKEENISFESVRQNLILTGDLFDRGTLPISDIFTYILDNNFKSVYGNHDYLLKNSYEFNIKELDVYQTKEQVASVWCSPKNGGDIVKKYLDDLKSGKIENSTYKFNDILSYVKKMKTYNIFEEEKLIVTHSFCPGILNNIMWQFENENINDILLKIPKSWYIWSNLAFNSHIIESSVPEKSMTKQFKDYKFVLGHIPLEEPYVNDSFQTFCVDTGAFRSGKLSAVVIYDENMYRFISVKDQKVY